MLGPRSGCIYVGSGTRCGRGRGCAGGGAASRNSGVFQLLSINTTTTTTTTQCYYMLLRAGRRAKTRALEGSSEITSNDFVRHCQNIEILESDCLFDKALFCKALSNNQSNSRILTCNI